MHLYIIPALLAAALCTTARADDAFFSLPIGAVKIVEGQLPEGGRSRWEMTGVLIPYAVLDGEGEAFITTQADLAPVRGAAPFSIQSGMLAARAPAGKPLTGRMFVPNSEWTALVPLKFTISEKESAPTARLDFFRAKSAHYDALHDSGAPGAAWFRYQADAARSELDPQEAARRNPRRVLPAELDDTYDLFTGGRAVSENLQLHRELPDVDAPAPEETVPLDSLEGITVQAMNWDTLLQTAGVDKNATPEKLALAIPHDQHAVFLPSFESLAAAFDEVRTNGMPVFRTLSPRSEDGRVIERYERQLGLSLTGLTRALGPRVVRSLAITGSDPYFPTGTDVAILFDSPDPKALFNLVLGQVTLATGTAPAVQKRDGQIDAVTYKGFASDDRSVSSYIALIGDTVVVTNSLWQLKRLAHVASGQVPALGSLPEYRFFRARYAPPTTTTTAADQTAFLFISDPAIRRWCGPKWRIAASRRLRAAAVLADLTAAHLKDLHAGSVKAPDPIKSDVPMRTIGDLALTPSGPKSSVYGVPPFLTPIAELDIPEVTKSEAASYKRWRDTYQRNWSWAFDPIGAGISIAPQRLAADLTVMPLILGTDYRTWMTFVQGVSIDPQAGDLHGAIAHGIVAMNVQSQAVQQAGTFALMMAPQVKVDPLGWLGKSVSLYADADPFWTTMLEAKDDGDKFFEDNIYRIPIGLHAEVDSAIKLTAFLAALRAYVDQSSPGMMAWENHEHNGRAYVTVGLSETARNEARGNSGIDRLKIHYAATPNALIVSPNEDVLKRALDRLAQRAAANAPEPKADPKAADPKADAKADPKPPADPAAAAHPWLGKSMGLQITREGLEILQGPGRETHKRMLQTRSWMNLYALNEWKRLFPAQDPIEVHQKHWGARLVCPAGGTYVWNEQFKTMESTICGHPGAPKDPPPGLGPLGTITSANFGLSFEDGGLRARAVLEREAAK